MPDRDARIDLERNHAQLNAERAATVVSFATLALAVIWVVQYGWWIQGVLGLGHVAIAVGVWGALRRFGSGWSRDTCDRSGALLTLPFLVTLWRPPILDLHGGSTLVEPLLLHHVLLISIAVLSPRRLAWGIGLVVLFTVHGLTLWRVLDASGGSPALEREPYLTLLVALVSVAVCWSRWRRRDVEIRLADAVTRAEAVTRLNRVLLALRDRANTPIQTLGVGLAILEDHPTADHTTTLAAMRNAVGDLTSMQQPIVETTHEAEPVVVDLERAVGDIHRWAKTTDDH